MCFWSCIAYVQYLVYAAHWNTETNELAQPQKNKTPLLNVNLTTQYKISPLW